MSLLRVIERTHNARVEVATYKAGAIYTLTADGREARGRSVEEAADAWLAAERLAEIELIAESGAAGELREGEPIDNPGPYRTTEVQPLPNGRRRVVVWERRGDGTLIGVTEEEQDEPGPPKPTGGER